MFAALGKFLRRWVCKGQPEPLAVLGAEVFDGAAPTLECRRRKRGELGIPPVSAESVPLHQVPEPESVPLHAAPELESVMVHPVPESVTVHQSSRQRRWEARNPDKVRVANRERVRRFRARRRAAAPGPGPVQS
jgi:hypothetical protein